jgi:hypothetical protein
MLLAITLVYAKSKLITSWKNPAYGGPKLHRILVIGVAKNPSHRADFEDALSQRMTRDGIEAIPGNTLLLRPDSSKPDLDYLRAQVREHKIEGVIVSRVVKIDRTATTVDPQIYSNSFYGYYGTVTSVTYVPGYTREDTKIRVETNLYATGNGEGQLLWTATSDSFDPKNAHKEIESLSKLIVRQLERDGFLEKTK